MPLVKYRLHGRRPAPRLIKVPVPGWGGGAQTKVLMIVGRDKRLRLIRVTAARRRNECRTIPIRGTSGDTRSCFPCPTFIPHFMTGMFMTIR